MDLYDELNKAILNNDTRLINIIKRKITYGDEEEDNIRLYIEHIKGKTLYKTLRKALYMDIDNADSNEDIDNIFILYVKLVSSMLTHSVIEAQIENKDIDKYPVKDLYIILGYLINSHDATEKKNAMSKCKVFLQDRYGCYMS